MKRVRVNAPHLKSHGKTGTVERQTYWSTGLTGVRLDDGHHISINSCYLESPNPPPPHLNKEHVGLVYVHDGLENPTDLESAKEFIGSLEPYAVMYGTLASLENFIHGDEGIIDGSVGEMCFAIWNEKVYSIEITRSVTHIVWR